MKPAKIHFYRVYTALLLAWFLLASPATILSAADSGQKYPGDFDAVRVEDDFNLQYEVGKSEELVNYLKGKYVDDSSFVKNLGPKFSASFGDEDFADTYFDTPNLDLYKRQIGLRYRIRINRLDPEDRKNGRELIQLKLSGDDKFQDKDNSGSRNEIKFEVEKAVSNRNALGRRPILGLIAASQRDEFKSRIKELDIDPYKLRPLFTLEQRRRRVYLNRDGATFISFSLDDARSSLWWAKIEFSQMEVELNELAYTEADKNSKKSMREIRDGMIQDLRKKFNYLTHDQSAKYNKTLDLLAVKIPWMRFWIRLGILRGRAPGA